MSTLDQPSGHFPVRAYQMYFGHLMRLARPQHFLKYRNHYWLDAKIFSKIIINIAKWTQRNQIYNLLPLGIVVPCTATLPIISGSSKLIEIIRWKDEQVQNLLFDFHNVPGDLMRCINALWFLCYNESVLLILWLQIVFVNCWFFTF